MNNIQHSNTAYTPFNALANRSFAFQRNLRHFLESYLMLFLKRFERLAHHRDKFVTRARRLQKHAYSICQSPIQPNSGITNLS